MPEPTADSPEKGAAPPPKCKAILLCDQTIVEAGTGKANLIGIFDGFLLPKVPGPTAPFTVFLELTDAIGRYDIVFEIHDLQRDQVIIRSYTVTIQFQDKLARAHLFIRCAPWPVTHVGAYDLVVFADGQEIDRQQFTVAQSPGTQQQEEQKHE